MDVGIIRHGILNNSHLYIKGCNAKVDHVQEHMGNVSREVEILLLFNFFQC